MPLGQDPSPIIPQDSVFVPAFSDSAAAQRDYYMRTGLYPIQHLVVMREELVHSEPWTVADVCELFVEAKHVAQSGEKFGSSGLPDESKGFLADPWPYGISANRTVLLAFVEAAHEQGLTRHLHSVEDLFAGNLPEAMQ